jgi:hypothetical protein
MRPGVGAFVLAETDRIGQTAIRANPITGDVACGIIGDEDEAARPVGRYVARRHAVTGHFVDFGQFAKGPDVVRGNGAVRLARFSAVFADGVQVLASPGVESTITSAPDLGLNLQA